VIDDAIKPNINAKSYAANKQKVKDLFRQAMPYLEKYKMLKPDDKDRWAPQLYRLYLTLNLDKKFAEIDTVLTKQAEAQKKK
jgi:hypothetical protein